MGGLGRIYRRGKKGTVWIAFYSGGRQIRESTHQFSEAAGRRLLQQRLTEVAAGTYIGKARDSVTFDDLWAGLVRDYEINGRRSKRALRVRGLHLIPFFEHRRALDITPALLARYIETRKHEHASNASINRELAILHRAFRIGFEQGRVIKVPPIKLLAEDNARQGFVEHEDFQRIRNALPPYLRDPVTFLYVSGWRLREMQTLRWRDIDQTANAIILRREHSKTGNARTLPMAGELADLIEHAKKARRLDCQFVFHRGVLPVGNFRKSWRKACAAVGKPGLLVHDLRRTAVRNLVRAGTPERVVMEISGHRTREIFDRYNIVSDQDMRAAMERLRAKTCTEFGPASNAAKGRKRP